MLFLSSPIGNSWVTKIGSAEGTWGAGGGGGTGNFRGSLESNNFRGLCVFLRDPNSDFFLGGGVGGGGQEITQNKTIAAVARDGMYLSFSVVWFPLLNVQKTNIRFKVAPSKWRVLPMRLAAMVMNQDLKGTNQVPNAVRWLWNSVCHH